MQSTRFARRTGGRSHTRVVARLATLASLGAVGILGLGCAESTTPTGLPDKPDAIIIIGGHPTVLNSQLRGVTSGWPPSTVGNVQIKLFADGHFELKGMVLDSQCSSLFGGGMYFVQDSEDMPSPESRAAIDIPLPEEGCGDVPVQFEVAGTISEELAARMVTDPEDFVFAFFADGGGVIAGTLQIGNPDETPTR